MRSKLRWGILSTAFIAENSVILGIIESRTGTVVAIASRDLAKAKKLANQFKIEKAYGSYDELLADEEIEAVYIPLPNHLHKKWTIKAAEAGKHILCEKPLALNTTEVRHMFEACHKAGVQLAEAFMYIHHPRYQKIKDLIQSDEIGEIRGINGKYTFNNAQQQGNIRHVKSWGGGGMYDVGCYLIHAARYLLESEPVATTVHANFSEKHDNVDVMATGMMEFENGIGMSFDCGIWAYPRDELEIIGTKGRIVIPSFVVADPPHYLVYTREGLREEKVEQVNHYALQADHLFKKNMGSEVTTVSEYDSIKNMIALDACLKSARENKRIVI